MMPTDCFFIDETTTSRNDMTDPQSWIAVATKVDGESLMKLATSTRIFQVPFKQILKKVREHLKVIHYEWGFFGSINMKAIYYDQDTHRVTLTDWGRSKLPFTEMPTDYLSGFAWPYDRMFKKTDEDSYNVMDELGVLCCFYNCTKFQAENFADKVLDPSKGA